MVCFKAGFSHWVSTELRALEALVVFWHAKEMTARMVALLSVYCAVVRAHPLCSWFPSTCPFSDDVCHGLAECFMPTKCRCASRNDRARACGSTGLDGKMCTLFALCRR